MDKDQIFDALINSNSFEELRDTVRKTLEAEELKAMEIAHAEKTEAEKRDAMFADIDINNLSLQMTVALGVTNGMPEWLVLQRFEAWKLAQSVE